MRFRKFIPPMSIVLFVALTLAGTYYVRLRILEKHMVTAMDTDDRAAVAQLARSFPSPVNERDQRGRTPLHRAAEWGDHALTDLLLRKGADIDARDYGGRTPLQEASANGQKEVVEILIASGADVNAKGGEDVGGAKGNAGKTALQLAVEGKHDAVADVLRKAGAKE